MGAMLYNMQGWNVDLVVTGGGVGGGSPTLWSKEMKSSSRREEIISNQLSVGPNIGLLGPTAV